MNYVHGGTLATQALTEAGVDVVFTLSGGHIFPLYDGCVSAGIHLVDTRHEQTAGFAAEVVATICEEAFYSLEAPVARVGGYDVPYPVGMLEESYVPDAARVVAAALRVCGEGA